MEQQKNIYPARLFVPAIVLFIFFAAACQKSGPAPTHYVNVRINNQPVSASGTNVYDTLSGNALLIQAVYGDTLLVFAIINFPNLAGTYIVGNNNTHVEAFYIPGILPPNFSGQPNVLSGAVTITSVNPYYTGSFSFTFDDSTQLTNGSFLVSAR
jgi:hypothetical protein